MTTDHPENYDDPETYNPEYTISVKILPMRKMLVSENNAGNILHDPELYNPETK